MKECFDACGDDDIPYIEGGYNSGRMLTKKELYCENERFTRPAIYQALYDKWQIKRAEPKVVDADWYWSNKVPLINNHTINILEHRKPDIIAAFEFADKNGQLREWLRPEQVELREAIDHYFNAKEVTFPDYIRRVKRALENLKPPTEL